uniref:receptor protein-tyrosine kinase n=1 Tax=Knipowitschia caucasica TaxID=637954 RepID=A0AAV2LBP7_KNICA
MKECSTSSSRWTPVTAGQPATSTQNHILTIFQHHQVLQGKNKTVGVLTVAEASVSGVYRCFASNSAGADHWDIHFYITDMKGGFSVTQEASWEGGVLHLTCRANKHMYSALSWTQMSRARPLPGQLSVGPFSSALKLQRHNVSAADSGLYRCSAHNLLTGRPAHLDIQVNVSILEAPVFLHNLSDSTVNSSSSVELQCLCHGVPPPTVTWYKGEHALLPGSGIMISPEDGTLHIERVREEDQGLYTCRATNERGSTQSSAHIWVNSVSEFSFLEVPTLTCTCVVATLLWLLLTLLIRRLRQHTKADYLSILLDTDERPLSEQCHRLQYDATQWEFPRERLKLGKPLGRGAFGKVVQASAFGIDNETRCRIVAVKMLKEGATVSEHNALQTELKILNHIGNHLNVVNLLGACTTPGGPLMIIVEYCRYGNLSSFLKTKRSLFVDYKNQSYNDTCGLETALHAFDQRDADELKLVTNSPLFLEDLISFSFQVARGMEFLASRKCIHRDLAARNVLLSENNVVKICDFGLARDIYGDPDYIRKGDARLPLKWMSPESIFDKVFTTQSDVWSFGILLWEIFSLGASPYPGLYIDETFCHRLKEGTRMRAPQYSTPEIYSTMLACWEPRPSDRPSFTELVQTLGDLLQAQVQQDGKHYIPLGSIGTEDSQGNKSQRDNPLAVTNLSYMRGMNSLLTFEEPSLEVQSRPDEEQSDSGMVLPSEELKNVTEKNSSKFNRVISCTELQTKHGAINDATSHGNRSTDGGSPRQLNPSFLSP